MKANIIVERFDNGVSIRRTNVYEGDTVELEAVVALDGDVEKIIGKMIWDDIENELEDNTSYIIKMHIKYENA